MSNKHRQSRDPEATFVAALQRISQDPAVRRELLWIRAMERGDVAAVAALERLDPGVGDRLDRLAVRILECALPPANLDDPVIRRELYLRIHDERFRHHYARVTREPCGCIECTGISFAEQAARDAAKNAGTALN